MRGSTGNDQGIARKCGGIEARALGGGGHRDHLGVAEHLPEALIFGEIERAVAAVVQAWNHHGAAVGQAEFIADERRDALRLRERLAVEEVARIERRIAQEFEHRSVDRVGARPGDDIGVTRRAAPDLGGHPAGTGTDLLHRIDVEVGEGSAAHFGIA